MNKDTDRKKKVTTYIVTHKDYRLKDKYKNKIGYTPKQVKTCEGSETKQKRKKEQNARRQTKKCYKTQGGNQIKMKAFDIHKVRVTLYTKVVG